MKLLSKALLILAAVAALASCIGGGNTTQSSLLPSSRHGSIVKPLDGIGGPGVTNHTSPSPSPFKAGG